MKTDLKPVKKVSLKKAKTTQVTDQKNLQNVKQKVAAERDLLYAYPPEVNTLDAKKKFRTAARRQRDSFQKRIKAAEGKEKAALQKEAKAWASEIYRKEHIPAF